jgi:uncharacterized repeat protein (TIGR03803 family)
MRGNRSQRRLTATLSIIVLTLIAAATPAAAQQESILYNFSAAGPQAGVVFDALGNLYGTDVSQGVYELTPQTGGGWTRTTIYNDFGSNVDTEGDLIFDSEGNLYGVAISGGGSNLGFVFELKPSSGGSWTEEILYAFPPTGVHGNSPYPGVIFDNSGNLYGTTFYGGAYGGSTYGPGGTVFELIRQPGGGWTEKLLHSFGNGTDGYFPYGGLILDSAGNLYGTTTQGGSFSKGTVFELSRQSNGQWKEKILYNFGSQAHDGQSPYTSLVFDSVGNLYGTTTAGGLDANGTAFELKPQAGGGRWKETVLLNFEGSNGSSPESALLFDSFGSLYGSTFSGGLYEGGSVYELVPRSDGTWQQSFVHDFGNGSDGNGVRGNLRFDASGNLFGTTQGGGTSGEGTVWEIKF